MKSIHKTVVIPHANGIFVNKQIRTEINLTMFDVMVYAIDFFKLSNIRRPCSIHVTIEAKLSSIRIISAACLLIVEPAIPTCISQSARDSEKEKKI